MAFVDGTERGGVYEISEFDELIPRGRRCEAMIGE